MGNRLLLVSGPGCSGCVQMKDRLQALGFYDDSIKSYQKAYDINPKGDDLSYKLALSFINNKELKKALDLLDEREGFLIQLGSLESELPQNKYYVKFQIKTIRTKVVEVLSNINLGSSYNLKKANVALSDVHAARSKIYADSTFENFNYTSAINKGVFSFNILLQLQ